MARAERIRYPLRFMKRGIEVWQQQHREYPAAKTLFVDAISTYRAHFWTIAGIMLIVVVPAAASSVTSNDTAGSTLSVYMTFAQLVMNAALIWALIRFCHGSPVGVREAYYKGSAVLVRLFLAILILAIMALPLGFGILLLSSILSPEAHMMVVEQILLTLLAIVLAIPTIILLNRGFLAIYVLYEHDLGPWQAIKRSFELTRGRLVLGIRRTLLLNLGLVAILVLPVVLCVTLAVVTRMGWPVFMLQVLVALVVLPLSNLYFYRYYQSLI